MKTSPQSNQQMYMYVYVLYIYIIIMFKEMKCTNMNLIRLPL